MRTWFVVVAMTAGASLAAGCTKVQGREAKPARPVTIHAVAAAPAPAAIRYSATIEPFQQVPLAFKGSGYVDTVVIRKGADGRPRVAQPGDHVAKGLVLARVREADYRERVTQAQAKFNEGDASLRKAKLDLDRASALFAAESLTKPDLDAAQAAYDGAQARMLATRADIELAQIALRDTELVAPASGVLLERRIEIGTLVGAGTIGFVLGDVSSVKAHFGIPDMMIHAVALGDRIDVAIEAAGAVFSGRVTALAPAADSESRVFDVEVTIPNADGRLRPGMIGTVGVGNPAPSVPAGSPARLTIPLSAVVKASPALSESSSTRAEGVAGPGYAVLVVERQPDGEVARLRPVELGDVTGNGVEVVKGVSAGERVIVSGASLVADGDRVRVMPGAADRLP
jgi:RND family efflux transporter MFP subunit